MLNIKFHENPSPMGVELFHVDGQTDRQAGRQTDGHNKNDSHFSKFFGST